MRQNILFLETDVLTPDIIQFSQQQGCRLVGVLSTEGCRVPEASSMGVHIIGAPHELSTVVSRYAVTAIVVAVGMGHSITTIKKLYELNYHHVHIYSSETFYEKLTGKVAVKHHVAQGTVPVLDPFVFANSWFRAPKVTCDLVVASVLLVLVLPLMVLIALAVVLSSRGPVVYVQERLGRHERPFKVFKFRTMVMDAERHNGPQWAVRGDERITAVGKLLRRLRLDELPQLINIIRREMSFVGPRPIRRHFADLLEKEIPFYSLRFSVKPGLTGWAQVNYHYGGSIEGHKEKFQYDLYYLKHASLMLDVRIFIQTIVSVLRGGRN